MRRAILRGFVGPWFYLILGMNPWILSKRMEDEMMLLLNAILWTIQWWAFC